MMIEHFALAVNIKDVHSIVRGGLVTRSVVGRREEVGHTRRSSFVRPGLCWRWE